MLGNKSKLYKWSSKQLNYPAPFDTILGSNKRRTVELEGKTEDIGLISGLINASVGLAEEELVASGVIALPTLNHSHMAAGASTVSSGEEAIFTEFTPISSDITQAAYYNPVNGALLGCVREEGQTITSALKFDGASRDIVTDCEAAWLAILINAKKQFPEIGGAYELVKRALAAYINGTDSTDPEYVSLEDGADQGLSAICWYMYLYISKEGKILLNLTETDTKFKKLNALDVESGEISPSKGKRIIPNSFQIFMEGRTAAKVFNPLDIDWEKYKGIPFERSFADFSDEERARIPENDPNEAPSPILVGILDEIARTWTKRPVLRTSRILLEGGSGSGKTYLARSVARHLNRPYATHICGSTDGPEEFQGIIVPYVKRNGVKIPTTTPEMPKEKLEAYLSNPSLLWPKDFEMDMLYDPEEAKDKAKNLIDNILGLIKGSLSPDKQSDTGISYEYIPSSITAAIENGWVLEIQEPTCLLQQSALSCLFDALDKGSEGYFKTPCGEIKRHSDFICIVTQNRKYKGTKPLNEAARNRFPFIEKMEDPSKPIIENRLLVATGVKDLDLISQVVDLYLALKEKGEDLNADGVVSFRNLQDFLDAINDGIDTKWAFERYLLNAVTTDTEDQGELIEAVEDCALLEGIYD